MYMMRIQCANVENVLMLALHVHDEGTLYLDAMEGGKAPAEAWG